jgi:hypothetical protein
MSLTLVDKFEAVQVTASDNLPAEDIEFCTQQTEALQFALNQIEWWNQMFHCYKDLNPNPAYSIREGYSDRYELSTEKNFYRGDDSGWAIRYEQFHYTPDYDIVHCQKLRTKAKNAFVHRIYKYFEEKYKVELDTPEFKNQKAIEDYKPCYKSIIEDIRKQLGGTLDFRSIAIRRHIDLFRAEIYSTKNVTLNGKAMTIDNYQHYDFHYSEPTYRIDRWNTNIQALSNAISIFESDEVIDRFIGSHFLDTDINFGKEWHVLNCQKLEGITFYKNRKVKLKFKSPAYAKEFYDLFELGTISR